MKLGSIDSSFVIMTKRIKQMLLDVVFIGVIASAANASQVTITPTDLAPTFTVDDTIPLISFSFQTIRGNPAITSIVVTRTGIATDTDVPAVLVYEDTNQDNVIDDLTSPIGQAAFSSGSATISNLDAVTISTTTNWLIAFTVDINANQTNSAGGQINSTDITLPQGTSITYSGITTGSYTLPVDLTHWSAVWQGRAVELYWRTETEVDNLKWIIQRSMNRDTVYEIIHEEFKQAGEMTTPFPTEYKHQDTGVEPGNTYYYILVDVAIDGVHTYHGPVGTAGQGMDNSRLSGRIVIGPNPFYLHTTLEYTETADAVSYEIYSYRGELVRILKADKVSRVRWDDRDVNGQEVPAGTYIYRIFRETGQGRLPLAEGKVYKLK